MNTFLETHSLYSPSTKDWTKAKQGRSAGVQRHRHPRHLHQPQEPELKLLDNDVKCPGDFSLLDWQLGAQHMAPGRGLCTM